MLSRGNSFHRHSQHSTYRSHLHNHSFSPLSVSNEDVIHIIVHTYRSSYKEVKHTHHTAFRSDYISKTKNIFITTFHYLLKHIVSILIGEKQNWNPMGGKWEIHKGTK